MRKEIPDDAARVAALRSGEVDLINYVPASDYVAMQNDGDVETFVSDSVYILNVAPSVKDEEPQPITLNGEPVDGNPAPGPARAQSARPRDQTVTCWWTWCWRGSGHPPRS